MTLFTGTTRCVRNQLCTHSRHYSRCTSPPYIAEVDEGPDTSTLVQDTTEDVVSGCRPHELQSLCNKPRGQDVGVLDGL